MFDRYNKVQKAVLETTLSLIIEKELQATSMSLIAKKSGISTGSIYHYFDSKETIINELYKAIVLFNGEYVLQNVYTDEPLRTRLERAWENMIRLSLEYPTFSSLNNIRSRHIYTMNRRGRPMKADGAAR